MSTPSDYGFQRCSRCGTQRPVALMEHGPSVADIACADHDWCDREAKPKRVAELEAQLAALKVPR